MKYRQAVGRRTFAKVPARFERHGALRQHVPSAEPSLRCTMRALSFVAVCTVAAACGGISGDYEDALHGDSYEYGVNSCGSARSEPGVASMLYVENPGEHAIEFREISVVDANIDDVEMYVVSVPSTETISFGTASYATVGESDAPLAEAWAARSTPPASVPPGTTGQVLVVIPVPDDGRTPNYVFDFEITVAVDGAEHIYDWRSLQMMGDHDACEEVSTRLDG